MHPRRTSRGGRRCSTRVLTAAALFVLWTAGIEARLVYLQVIDHADMQARADRQHMRTITAPAKRGEIVDRNGQCSPTASTRTASSPIPRKSSTRTRSRSCVCGALDDCSARERQEMAQALRRDTQFAYLARKVSPDEAQRVKALELKGVGFVKESRRYYPKKELAAHVLGYVGLDNTGLAGLESTYDAQVRGREGKVLIQTDARRHALNSRVDRPATAGAALELTIDQYLQYIAERELRAGVEENRAAGGTRGDHGSAAPARSSRSPTGRRSTRTRSAGPTSASGATAPSRTSTSPDRRSRSSPHRRRSRSA